MTEKMSARESLPSHCSSPPDTNAEHASIVQRDFKSFSNPALGLSVSCSLAQLADLKQMLTPVAADQAQPAPFFTPFSNKTYDTAQVSESMVFYTAMGTGLRSSQSTKADVNRTVQSRRFLGRTLVFVDAAGPSRPNSQGSAITALEASKLVAIAAPELRNAEEAEASGGEAVSHNAADIRSPDAAAETPRALELDVPADAAPESLALAKADADTQAPSDAGDEPVISRHTPRADSTVSLRPQSASSSHLAQSDAVLHSPVRLENLAIQALLPAAFLLEDLLEGSCDLLEGSGETSGNRKHSPGPAESTHAQGQPPTAPKRDKGYGTTACMPRSAQTCATPRDTGTSRKPSGGATPAHRHRSDVRDTPASSAKPPASGKQGQSRAAKAGVTVATTPGRHSAQKPRRPSTVGADVAREVAPRVAVQTTQPRSADAIGAACNAGVAKAAPAVAAAGEDAGPAGTGTGTPLFLKRVRPALGTSSPGTPFSALKCPPAVSRGPPGCTTSTVSFATGTAALSAAVSGAAPSGIAATLPPGKAQDQQRVKRAVRQKPPAVGPATVKGAETDAKAGVEAKAVAIGNRSGAGGDAPGARRNPSGSGPKAPPGSKAVAPNAAPATAKAVAGIPGTRAGAAASHASKPPTAAAAHAGAQSKEAGKQAAASKQAAEVATKTHNEKEGPQPEGEAAQPQVRLGRVSNVSGANASGAAAGRYSKAQLGTPEPAPMPSTRTATSNSPDKLQSAKRCAAPVTSPSKRPRQERNPSQAAAQAGAAARAASASGRAGAARGTARRAGSPPPRGALTGKGSRSHSANGRRPRGSSIRAILAEHVPLQIPLQFTLADVGLKVLAPPAVVELPADQPAQVQPIPKLDFDCLAQCKSPNAAAVAADMVPLRRQPVSARGSVLAGGAALARRPSVIYLAGSSSPMDAPLGMLLPAAAAAEVQVASTTAPQHPQAPIHEPPKQLDVLETPRDPLADPSRAATLKPVLGPVLGGAVKAKGKSDNANTTTVASAAGRAAGAVACAAGDALRPPTARQAVVASASAANGTLAPRSARPGAVHKPTSAAGSSAAGAPKATAPAAAGSGAGVHKGAVPTPPVVSGAGKTTKAVAAAVAPSAAVAPKSRPLVLASSRPADTAPPHHGRDAEPQGPATVTEDNNNNSRNAPRQAPRGPARPEPFARGAKIDAEQERAQRRRQYEALLGRTGGTIPHAQELPHAQEPLAAVSADGAPAVAATAATGNTAPAPAAKPGTKPLGARASAQVSLTQPERLPARKAALPQMAPPRAAMRQLAGPVPGGLAPQLQRGKAAPVSAKHAAPTSSTGSRAAAARGRPDPFSGHAADVRTAHMPTPDSAPEVQSRGGGLSDMVTASSTAASEEPLNGEPSAVDGAPKEAESADTHGGTNGTVPEEAPTLTRPQDLSWLVDASPYTSLAVTPGALVAVNASPDSSGFGFGASKDSNDPASIAESAVSPSFHAFGVRVGDAAAHPAAGSTSVLGEGCEAAGPFGTCQGDAIVVVRRQSPSLTINPVGLPPTGLAAASGQVAVIPTPHSIISIRSAQQLTPGPGQPKICVNFAKVAAGGTNNSGPAPGLLPHPKLRFSWDPAHGVTPPLPGTQAFPSLGVVDNFLGFSTAAVQGATPVSMPNPGHFGATGLDHPEPGGKMESAGPLGDAENALDQDLGAEVPVPMQCTSPNTPAPDAFGALVLGGGVGGGDQGIVVFGGGAAGMGRGGRTVQDSFDALRISSMSSWPMLRDREQPGDVTAAT